MNWQRSIYRQLKVIQISKQKQTDKYIKNTEAECSFGTLKYRNAVGKYSQRFEEDILPIFSEQDQALNESQWPDNGGMSTRDNSWQKMKLNKRDITLLGLFHGTHNNE